MEKIDRGLLRKLCKIHHYSGEEYKMITFILNYVYRLDGITLEIDGENNLFITKNTTNPESYPVVVAHLDEVLRYKGQKKVIINNDTISGYYTDDASEKNYQCGLGLDDTFGIYCALHLLTKLPNLKIVFTTKEEMGCIGAETAAFNLEFFENARFMLQADRRGKSDLITHTNGLDVTSDEFLSDIAHLMHKYKYKKARGTMTDIGTLKETINVSACNISCGYYNAHTHTEYGILSELQNCLNFMYEIITTCTKVYPHTVEHPVYTYTYAKYYKEYSDDQYDFIENQCQYCRTWDCENCKLLQ